MPQIQAETTTKIYRTRSSAGAAVLFLNRRGGRLSARSIGHLVDGFAARAGLVDEAGKTVSVQDLRDTFGANLGREGAGASLIAALMGYRAAGSARPYMHPTEPAAALPPADQ